jgi:GAF domain-containing protein
VTAEELLAALADTANELAPAVQPVGADRLLRALTETARQLFGAAACSLALLSDDESELVYTTAAGQGAEDITGMRMPSTRGLAGMVVRTGQPIAISDVANDPRFARDVAQQTGYVPQAILAVPVVSPARVLGVLSVLDRDARRPGSEADMRLLSLFADQAALALESVNVFRDLGRVLLVSLATAAADNVELADAAGQVAEAAGGADRRLTELVSAFATLAARGEAESLLAAAVLRDVAAYVSARSPRTR